LKKKLIALNLSTSTEHVFSYRICRTKNNEPAILLKTIDGKNHAYIDKDLNQNNVYSYTLEAIFISGIHSQMSLAVEVGY
jgi:hypothetical protein